MKQTLIVNVDMKYEADSFEWYVKATSVPGVQANSYSCDVVMLDVAKYVARMSIHDDDDYDKDEVTVVVNARKGTYYKSQRYEFEIDEDGEYSVKNPHIWETQDQIRKRMGDWWRPEYDVMFNDWTGG